MQESTGLLANDSLGEVFFSAALTLFLVNGFSSLFLRLRVRFSLDEETITIIRLSDGKRLFQTIHYSFPFVRSTENVFLCPKFVHRLVSRFRSRLFRTVAGEERALSTVTIYAH